MRTWRAVPALFLVATVAAIGPLAVSAQTDTTIAQEGLYDRPFVASSGGTSIGGYLEGNSNYTREEGVSDGFSMELRRFNIFLFSSINPRIRFLSELEFEHGTEEIALETAQIDVRIHSGLVLRAGIILPPLGYLNQNHDSPRWDFVDRPLVSTEIIPSTLSEVGAGLYGKLFRGPWTVSYDAYLTNGLQDGVIDNDLGRTDIPSGKSEDAFAGDNNGSPAVSGRIGLHHGAWGEVGVSHYSAHYNPYRLAGETIDARRAVRITALDFGAVVAGIRIRSEVAHASIDVPPDMGESFGEGQWGAHLDVLRPVWTWNSPDGDDVQMLLGLRLEQVDFNTGTFESTGRPMVDEVRAIVPTISMRTSASTVLRFNYRFHRSRDFQGNPTRRLGSFQLGFATYF